MPIYEFYCSDCHTLFNFYSSRVDTETLPSCPRCDKPRLERKPARFATLRSSGGGDDELDQLGLGDEERLEQAMESVLAEAGDLDRDDAEDPAQMARIFRRFGAAAGLEPGPKLEEMLRRLEQGEDPETLENEMEEVLGEDASLEELFRQKTGGAHVDRRARPRVDEKLYFL